MGEVKQRSVVAVAAMGEVRQQSVVAAAATVGEVKQQSKLINGSNNNERHGVLSAKEWAQRAWMRLMIAGTNSKSLVTHPLITPCLGLVSS